MNISLQNNQYIIGNQSFSKDEFINIINAGIIDQILETDSNSIDNNNINEINHIQNELFIEIEKPKNNNSNDNFIKSLPKNSILLGSANSGKNVWINDNIQNKYNNITLSFDNIEQNWKNHLFKINNFNGKYHIGEIFKYIVSATIHIDTPYFITSMEIGSYDLRNILGNVLKDILKENQRVTKDEISVVLKKLNISKNITELSIEDYINIGNCLKLENPYKVTYFQIGDYNLPLWLTENLYFFFAANNGEELEESLEIENYSWSDLGNRFRVIPFNNFLLNQFNDQHSFDIFKVTFNGKNNEENNIKKIEIFNKEVYGILKDYIDMSNYFNSINYLIPNFSKIGNSIEDMKKFVLREMKKNLDDDYEEILEKIQNINLN